MFLVLVCFVLNGPNTGTHYLAIDDIQEWHVDGNYIIIKKNRCGSFKFKRLLSGKKDVEGSGLVFIQLHGNEYENLITPRGQGGEALRYEDCPIHLTTSEDINTKYKAKAIAFPAFTQHEMFSNHFFGKFNARATLGCKQCIEECSKANAMRLLGLSSSALEKHLEEAKEALKEAEKEASEAKAEAKTKAAKAKQARKAVKATEKAVKATMKTEG